MTTHYIWLITDIIIHGIMADIGGPLWRIDDVG